MATHIDPEKKATYPIVLSDELMGRGTKEIITGIRYNHKPTEASTSLKNARIKPTSPSDPDTYDLSFDDSSGKYEYQGTRKPGEGHFVLIFDPPNQRFVLHQVDSTFDVNLTNVPWPHEPGSLRDTYEQLQTSDKSRRKIASAQRTRATKENAAKDAVNDNKRRKGEKNEKKPPPREPTPDAEDEESDDGLTIEYPGGKPPPRFGGGIRSSPLQQKEAEPDSEEDAHADFEDDDEPNNDVEALHLDQDMEDDLELDLEAELEQELEKQQGRQDESDVSEED